MNICYNDKIKAFWLNKDYTFLRLLFSNLFNHPHSNTSAVFRPLKKSEWPLLVISLVNGRLSAHIKMYEMRRIIYLDLGRGLSAEERG